MHLRIWTSIQESSREVWSVPGTVLGSIVPWDASAILYSGLFGVSVAQYLPFNLVAILSPVIAVLTAYIGFGVLKYNEQMHFTMKLRKYK